MDQDLNFQHRMAFAAGAKTSYFQVPYRCTLRKVSGIVQADPGDAETVTVTTEPTVGGTSAALGTLTFGTDIAAGAVGTWAADATTGATVIEKGEFIKFVTSAGADADLDLNIELDPYARTTE
jgi:phosphoribosylaminoimidazole (AIR) synthetase